MGNNKPDERTALLIDECEKELLKVIEPKFVYRVFDIARKEDGVEVIGTPLFLDGNDIRRHLEGCSKCVLFAATISSGVDRKLRAYEADGFYSVCFFVQKSTGTPETFPYCPYHNSIIIP